MKRPLLLVAALTLVTAQLTMRNAAAQTGWVHLRTHPVGNNNGIDYGVSRTFEQSGSGTVETFTLAYAPGTHTLARVETQIGPCRATASNITFTIAANQWTEVDVPVTEQDCSFQVAVNGWDAPETGTGTVVISSGSTAFATCTVARNPARGDRVFWANYHECQATVPYNENFQITATPDGNSGAASGVGGSQVSNENVVGPTVEFGSNFQKYYNDSSFSTDLAIHRVRSSYGGQVMSSTFEVVNRGPNIASNVIVGLDAIIGTNHGEEGSPVTIIFSGSDGVCGYLNLSDNGCRVNFLGVGDSISVTVRIDGTPDQFAATTITPRCATMNVSSQRSDNDHENGRSAETDPSNNSVSCADTSAPATVVLGGSSPTNHTVAAGATNVPMIEFTLNPTSPQTVNSVTIAATGSGNEQVDVTAVKLYVDKNGNGQVDSGDSAIASGAFAANNGTVTLTVDPAYSISSATNLLVTYDFNLTVAQRLGGGLTLAMFPLLFLPAVWRRKRLIAMIVIAMITTVTMTACGGDSTTGPPGGGSKVTYQADLTSVNISGNDVASSLTGATITIDK